MTHDIMKRRLGKTDIEITPIGLGTMEFSGGKGPINTVSFDNQVGSKIIET